MAELTEDMARKIDRASQILSGLARVASRDCTWLRRNPELHAEILDLQQHLREAAARVTGTEDLGAHFEEAQSVGILLTGLFQPEASAEETRNAGTES